MPPDFSPLWYLGEHSAPSSSNQSPTKSRLEQILLEGLSRMGLPVVSKGHVLLFFFPRVTWLTSLLQNRRNSSGAPWNGASVLYQATGCWPDLFTRYPTALQSDLVSESSPRWNTKAAQAPESRRDLSTSHITGVRAPNALWGQSGLALWVVQWSKIRGIC